MNDLSPRTNPPEVAPFPREAAARPAPRRRRARRTPLWLGLVALAVLAAGAWWWMRGSDSASEGPTTVEVTRGDVADLVSALGTLQPFKYVDVGAQVSGQLQRLHVRIGDRVTAGQLLAEIDSRVLQSRVQTDRAELERQRGLLAQQTAQRALAETQARRQRQMFTTNATSRDALDTAVAAVEVLDAQMAQTRAQITGQQAVLAADETSLSFGRIAAPMEGTVVSITAVEGQTLNANQTAPIILRIADLTTMTVSAQVSEADQPKLTIGMPVWFNTLGRPERRYESQLRQIYPTPEVVNNVVLYNALFDVANEDGALLPQMSAHVFFVRAAATNAVLVPVAAIAQGRGRSSERRTVQVVTDGGIEQRVVEVGVTDRVVTEVRSGLEPGERVVIGGGADPAGAERPRQRPAGRTPRL